MSERWRDSYDAWKLATPPEYDITAEEERALEEQAQQLQDEFRDNLLDCIHAERGSLTKQQILNVLLAIYQDGKF